MKGEYSALILAAGCSSRMGTLKPLLALSGGNVLESTVECFANAGIQDIVIVVGYQAQQIQSGYRGSAPVRFVCNERYHDGMFSSVQAGVEAMGEGVSAFLMMPADCPLVQPQTVCAIIRRMETSRSSIVVPTHNGRGGHPLLVSMRYRDEILSAHYPLGMRTFLTLHAQQIVRTDVGDAAILNDMDTPRQYEAIRVLSENAKESG